MDATPLKQVSHALSDERDLDVLIEAIGDSRCVLLGEASHGSSEYYVWRARLSRRLIEEKGFSFIAVEGDWPDCYQLNRYIKAYAPQPATARQLLHSFDRWPTWMWANWETDAMIEWLRRYNHHRAGKHKVGFYGLDVYSLWESMESIINYLQTVDGESVNVARAAYRCFEPFNRSEQAYARATRFVDEACEDRVIDMLHSIRQKVQQFPQDDEAAFSAEQNALVSLNAERYYRAMIRGNADSWNIRDQHFMQSLERLMQWHAQEPGREAKAIVWAHNTHVGDARYTDMKESGMVNLGQLARERYGENEVFIVGFASYQGTVIAAREWGNIMQETTVPPAQKGSWEALLHLLPPDDKILLLRPLRRVAGLMQERGHRAIGVVYRPELEQYGNYVPSVLPMRYDALIFTDESTALHAMHVPVKGGKVPETYPWGM